MSDFPLLKLCHLVGSEPSGVQLIEAIVTKMHIGVTDVNWKYEAGERETYE